MARIRLNGREIDVRPGESILKTCAAMGVEIPHLCYDERLKPYGGCRLCVVDLKGAPRPVTACDTRVADGMEIQTHTPELEELRTTLLRLIAKDYPGENPERVAHTPLGLLFAQYNIRLNEKRPEGKRHRDDHPYIGLDMGRCISCNRCVRVCDEVQGQFVWQVWGRGENTRVRPTGGVLALVQNHLNPLSDDAESLLGSACVSCGACADTCPSGAIFDKQPRETGEAENWVTTTCVYCGVGCQMHVGSRDGRVVSVKPAYGDVNRGHLCVKGRYAFGFNSSPDRQGEPMIRRHGAWEVVTWEEALAFAADGLRKIKADHGPDSIGLLGSARATNEENYLLQKFARTVIGTNNVDCCARVCHTPSAAALKLMLGTGAATNSFDDIERADLILICGANVTENHPIVGARIKQARFRGARLIVIDPRVTEIATYADMHLAVKPGGNVPLLNAMAYTIVAEKLCDEEFISTRVDDYAAFREFIADFTPESAAPLCGVDAGTIREAARLYAMAGSAMCFHGLGVTEHHQGTEGVMALVNLALLTGNLGKAGAGINPLRGQNNVQGAAHMGCDPGILTGSQNLQTARSRFEEIWGAAIPERKGLSLMDMIDKAKEDKLRALWVFGYDIYFSLPDAAETAAALAHVDLIIVQDLFLNETARRFGTVFFPAASVFERDGTFMNSDRRVQRIRRAVPAPGNARPDGEIICALAEKMGAGRLFPFRDAESVWNEVRRVWPDGAGLSYHRIETESLHWPCPSDEHPGTPVLHRDAFAPGVRAALKQIPFVPTPEQVDAEFPFLLSTGRNLYHFNAGTMTLRTGNTALLDSDYLDISAADAARLGFRDGEKARIKSRYGETVLPLRISSQVRPGILYTTFHFTGLFVNRITSSVRDRYVKAPEYKVTAVALLKYPDG